MRRAVLLIAVIWLSLLAVAQTLIPLPPAGPVRPGDSWGVISGVLTAEDGTPVVDTVLTAGIYRWDAVNNMPLCAPCVWGRTDDDGTFVLKGLLPGHYSIMVMPDPRSPRVAPDNQGRVYPYRGARPAWRRKHVMLVSAYLGDKDIAKEGFHFDGIVPGTLRLTVRLPPE